WNARRRPLVAVGVGWYFLLIAPSTFVHLNTVLMENRGYTASMGVAVVVGWLGCAAWRTLAGRRRAAGVLFGVVLAAFALIGWQRQQVWATNLAVWEDAVAHDPRSEEAWANLGKAYFSAGRLAEAERAYLRVLADHPDAPQIATNLAGVYLRQGRHREALAVMARVAALDPANPVYLTNLFHAQMGVGQAQAALATLRRLMRAEADNLATRRYPNPLPPGASATTLVDLALRLNRPEDARQAILLLARTRPDYPLTPLLAMRLHAFAGNRAAADAALAELARRLPGDPRLPGWRAELAQRRGGPG
ncbi:MAG: tetratricopeptide repeat protein, partial [Nitrospirae bacterium]|nr:tetratricopeptide repeat protein [Nitrospirota bacterium]